MVSNSVVMQAGSSEAIAHAQRLEKRWETLEARMTIKAESVRVNRAPEVRFLNQALSAGTSAKKIFWLRKAADTVTQALVGVSACKSGCSHCCHIAVTVSRTEAVQISKEIGRPLNPNAGKVKREDMSRLRMDLHQAMYGVPCTFLEGGRCSIYEVRPLACRLQINMDDDDLLCKLVENSMERVPYVDMTHHHRYAAMAMDHAHDDLRNWFAPV